MSHRPSLHLPALKRTVAGALAASLLGLVAMTAPPAGAAETGAEEAGAEEAGVTPDHVAAPRGEGSTESGRIVVGFHDEVSAAERDAALDELEVEDAVVVPDLPVALGETDDLDAALEQAVDDPRIAWVEGEVRYHQQTQRVGPEHAETRVTRARAAAAVHPEAALRDLSGAGITVAVIDSGVDHANPDLVGRVEDGGDWIDVTESVCFGWDAPPSGVTPTDWHGTAVASLIAGSDDDQGIVGAAPAATIRSYTVIGADGSGSSIDIACAILDAALTGVDVINLSLGGPFESHFVRFAVDWATGLGAGVVAAAGNDGGEYPSYPAGVRGVLSVGASAQGSDGVWRVARWSNRGEVDVLAPGGGVWTWVDGEVRQVDGTSFAAPQVAGILAGLASIGIEAEHARALLVATARKPALVTGLPATASGVGRVDALGAFNVVDQHLPFSAVFVDNGSVIAQRAYRDIEVIRYTPDAADKARPAITVPRTVGERIYPRDTTRIPLNGSARANGRLTRWGGGVAVHQTTAEGTEWKLTPTLTGDRTRARPMTTSRIGSGPEGWWVAPRKATTGSVRHGVRSNYVRYIGAYAGDTVTVDFGFPDAVADVRPSGPTMLGVWFPWDVNDDGVIDDRDRLPLASYEPDLVYTRGARAGTWTFKAPVTGTYAIGFRTFDRRGNGSYRLRLTAPTTTAKVTAPAIATRVHHYPAHSYFVTWEPTGPRAARVDHYEAQWSQRRKQPDGTWAWTSWKNHGSSYAHGRINRTTFGNTEDNTAVRQGGTYRVRVRAIDDVGNAGAWSQPAVTRVPIDDRHTSVRIGGAYFSDGLCDIKTCFNGTQRETSYRRAADYSVKMTAETRSFTVIGRKCSNCGVWRVYIDGAYAGRFDTAGSGSNHVLWNSGRLGSAKPRTIELRARTTADNWRIYFDAVVLER